MSSNTPQGYHGLALVMGRYTEAAIFRRFGLLNAVNIMSLQAELVELQDEYLDICNDDEHSGEELDRKHSRNFRILRQSLNNGQNSSQYEKLLEIRQKLHEYNTAVIEAAQMARLDDPAQADLDFLRDWLYGKREDQGQGFLQGSEAFTWSPINDDRTQRMLYEADFLTLHRNVDEQDYFSKQLSSTLLNSWTRIRSFWRRKTSRAGKCGDKDNQDGKNTAAVRKVIDPEKGVLHYNDAGLVRFNNILVSVISSALPVLAIVALYFVQTMRSRIGVLVAFTVAFALALATFTNARRIEIFASTAA